MLPLLSVGVETTTSSPPTTTVSPGELVRQRSVSSCELLITNPYILACIMYYVVSYSTTHSLLYSHIPNHTKQLYQGRIDSLGEEGMQLCVTIKMQVSKNLVLKIAT